ncbi:MAG: Asp-tRNA(Asn)/Glu-tRNA(Gln) amidotransferase subunit GatB [Candidatus Zambryskibacteria bacterium]|nr:Asp-tRNA(Asn)/Glu-tRNA(Gln) amidotransferase subunit GatB [Candidatus Zambryskibacteria bacterium]
MKIENSKIGNYRLTVGLEIHAELNTKTKMFCDSKNDPDETRPNVNICPVCMGYPGALPIINKEALIRVLRLGLAVGGELTDYTEFDRKNYFYPDIPKGYQISQYKYPLVKGGELSGVKITRVHLEEDTAKSMHGIENSKLKIENSLLDFNRAGVPLMELVTEPVIRSAEEAAKFAKELQLLLIYLGIAEVNMEKGEMRVEANISVSKGDKLGIKVEVKNLNSFRSVERAIRYEFERQISLLETGDKVVQETRGWDENKAETYSQRLKEESHDYRYFPDPDLPRIFIKEVPEFALKTLQESLPELPWQKREQLSKLGISKEHVEIYVTQPEWGSLFEEAVALLGGSTSKLVTLASNYITSELKSHINVEQFSEVIKMISLGEISSKGAKEIIKILQEEGGVARNIAEKNNLMQISDREILKEIVEEVLKEEDANAPVQYLIGQVIKKSKGRANPQILQEIFQDLLK